MIRKRTNNILGEKGYMNIKVYDKLPKQAKYIREAVFMKEQGFKNEYDDIDNRAIHLVLYVDDEPAATCRIFFSDEHKCYMIGRLAVLSEYRGTNLSKKILENAQSEIRKQGGKITMLSAQYRLKKFYENIGYKVKGDTYLDEGCPHILMSMEL